MKAAPIKKGKTLADFKAMHDPNVIVPAKIKKALADMEAENPENWEYEQPFMKRAGVSQTHIGQFREQFVEHIVETSGKNPKRIWVCTKKAAAKFRE